MNTTPNQQPLWDWNNQPLPEPAQLKSQPLPEPAQPKSQPLPEPTPPKKTNPCIALYGPHTDEHARCKNCVHLISIALSRNVYKCDLRQNTRSARTDHRLTWPACAKFAERTGEMPIYDGRT